MTRRRLTKWEWQSEALVLHYERLTKRGKEAVGNLLSDLDAADEEIVLLRNALRMALHRYMEGDKFTSQDEDLLVELGALDNDKCFITEYE